MEDLQSLLDTLLAIRRERVKERPSDADRCRTKRDGLNNVRRAADTTIDEQLELLVRELETTLLLKLIDDLHEDLNARARKVQLATAVVREDNAGKARIVCP